MSLLIAGEAFGRAVDIPAIVHSDRKARPTFAILQDGGQSGANGKDGGKTNMTRGAAYFGLAHRIGVAESTDHTRDDCSIGLLVGLYSRLDDDDKPMDTLALKGQRFF